MMGLTYNIINAGLDRTSDPENSLAAFAVAKSVILTMSNFNSSTRQAVVFMAPNSLYNKIQ